MVDIRLRHYLKEKFEKFINIEKTFGTLKKATFLKKVF